MSVVSKVDHCHCIIMPYCLQKQDEACLLPTAFLRRHSRQSISIIMPHVQGSVSCLHNWSQQFCITCSCFILQREQQHSLAASDVMRTNGFMLRFSDVPKLSMHKCGANCFVAQLRSLKSYSSCRQQYSPSLMSQSEHPLLSPTNHPLHMPGSCYSHYILHLLHASSMGYLM